MISFLKSITSIWASSIVSALCVFFMQAVLAWSLDPNELGSFQATLSYLLMFGALAGFGVDNALLKFFGFGVDKGNEYGKTIVIYSFCTTLLAILLLLIFTLFIVPDLEAKKIILLAPVLISLMFFNIRTAVLQIESRFYCLSLWQMLNNGSKLAFLSLILTPLFITDDVYILYMLSALVIISIGLPTIIKVYKGNVAGGIGTSSNKSDFLNVTKIAVPFGMAGLAHTIYFQSDIFLLSYLKSDTIAGLYSIAFTMTVATYLLPSAIYQKVLLPKIHLWSNTDREKMLTVFQLGNGIMLILGVIMSIVMYTLSDVIIPFLFGQKYIISADILKILCICIPVRFMIAGLDSVLSTGKMVIPKLKCMVFVAFFNFITNIIFIPYYGVHAAIITTILSEIILFILFLFVVKKELFGSDTFSGWFNFGILNSVKKHG